jgi:hypothetical protein
MTARTNRFAPPVALWLNLWAASLVSQELTFPPTLPDGQGVVTDSSAAMLVPADTLREGVAIAKTPPTIDFLYYGKQDYPGNPWSVWGDGCVANGKYYSGIGDHLAPQGHAFVYEYDPDAKKLRSCERSWM